MAFYYDFEAVRDLINVKRTAQNLIDLRGGAAAGGR